MMGLLARWGRRLTWRETARAFQVNWEAVYRSLEWFVEWGLAHRQLRGVESIGVDEIHWGRGLKADNFLTVTAFAGRAAARAERTGAGGRQRAAFYTGKMLVLASQSPRRSEILRQAGIEFTVRVADVDESTLPLESPAEYVQRLAAAKAYAVEAADGETILGADTTVVIDGEILSKPADAADACRMLGRLSGRRHEVLTGICLRRGGRDLRDYVTTGVVFAALSDAEIGEYVATGEPMDKAGAYAIQGLASKFVERIEGDYFNVMGLPVALVYRWLREGDSRSAA